GHAVAGAPLLQRGVEQRAVLRGDDGLALERVVGAAGVLVEGRALLVADLLRGLLNEALRIAALGLPGHDVGALLETAGAARQADDEVVAEQWLDVLVEV